MADLLMLAIVVVLAVAFVWIARRIRDLDARDGTRPGWPADSRRHDWH